MTSDPEGGYLYGERPGAATQSFASAPGIASYDAKDVRQFLKEELKGSMHFNSPNVLQRLGIDNVDGNLVENCINSLKTNSKVAESKETLLKLVAIADRRSPKEVDEEEANIYAEAKMEKTNYKEVNKRRERLMMEPLYSIFEMIRASGPATFEREWVFIKDSKLTSEGDTFSFPQIIPDFTVCEVVGPRNPTYEVNGGKRLWRRRLAFVELKASSNQGLQVVGARQPTPTDFTAQAADYARLHMSARPFQIFSVGLLIFGRKFCVAIFDRDGVEFSEIEDMWGNFKLFIRVIRRLSCDMTPYELGMDPNVKQLPLDNSFSKACRLYSQNIIPSTHRSRKEEVEKLAKYPTYSIKFYGATYYTIGLPIWTSLSLMGRGTNVWTVTSSPNSSQSVAASLLIMKSAWRRSGRTQESLIYEHVRTVKSRFELESREQQQGSFGRPEGLVEHSIGGDVSFPDSRKLTAANLRDMSGNQENDTTILHRVFFKTIGRPLWEFDNFLELFLGIRAALAGHKFLVDAKILHRDVSAGNLLLSLNSDVPDERRGFLTDLEFARIEDEQLEAQRTIAVPPIPTPGGYMTSPTTRTHTTWSSVQRGAPMTGTVQFMACELVEAMADNRAIKHEVYHDVESFVWVIYYATLRRLAYVKRPLQDINIPDEAIIKKLKTSFKGLFGYIDLNRISRARAYGEVPVMMFGRPLLESFNAPLIQFFDDLQDYVIKTRQTSRSKAHPFGKATYDGLFSILDQGISELRQLDQYQQL